MIKFGTDGWRAIMDREFTVDRVAMVAQAIANYLVERNLGSRVIVVGYDTRRNSRLYAETAASVLCGNNIAVLLPVRDLPTPVVAYTIKYRGLGGGIMLTASHNPPAYNGIKFIPETAMPALPVVTDAIERNIGILTLESVKKIELQEAKSRGLLLEFDAFQDYRKHVLGLVDTALIRNAGLRIVHDALFGTSRSYLPTLLSDAGCEVIEIHNWADPVFGGMEPNPEERFLGKLKRVVVERGANFGVANDGDADRIGVVDEHGTYIHPNVVFSLLASYLAGRVKRKGAIVRSIATTHLVDRIAESHGLELIETPVGFKWLAKAMIEKNGLIAGEESGGVCFSGHVAEKDGLLTALFLAEMIAANGKPLSQLVLDLKKRYGDLFFDRISIAFQEEKMPKLIERLKLQVPREIAGLEVVDISTLDGLKLTLKGGAWLLIRPSGTEPVVRIYGEAASAEILNKILAEGKRFVMEGVDRGI